MKEFIKDFHRRVVDSLSAQKPQKHSVTTNSLTSCYNSWFLANMKKVLHYTLGPKVCGLQPIPPIQYVLNEHHIPDLFPLFIPF